MKTTPLYRAYAAATRLALPFAQAVERRKLRAAGMGARVGEKAGRATLPRPEGRLIWFHAASVGESVSVLSLIERMGRAVPDASFLITSGTATSAEVVAKRMPPRCIHQFAPLDAPGPLARFLAHWAPDAAILVESELWPQMLWRTHLAGVPMALLNARLSERSVAQWVKRPETARMLLSVFRLILTQNAQMAQSMVQMGAEPLRVAQGVNLKSLSEPLPLDAALLEQTRAALDGRPVWVASSTHDGEEAVVLEAHSALLASHPDLCLILAPRHPERAEAVAEMIAAKGWPVLRRSQGEMPSGDAPVYLADSLGELGVWYALTDLVFLGGSLKPIGGHNPFEVAQAGAAVLSGPHVENFAETYETMAQAGAVRWVPDAGALVDEVAALMGDGRQLTAMKRAAEPFAQPSGEVLGKVARQLLTALELTDA